MELHETEGLWERLSRETRPVVLYGMGDGAEKILTLCRKFGVAVQAIFASDEFVRGQIFAGFPVMTYRQVCAKYERPIILVSFGTEKPEVLEHIYAIAEEQEVLAPDVPLFGDEVFDMKGFRAREKEIETVYGKLADDASRQVFSSLLNYKLSGKVEYLRQMESAREEVFRTVFSFSDEEVYVDLGAYDGDTITEFLQWTNGAYRKILALEPDRKNFVKLKRRFPEAERQRMQLLPYASWKEKTELVFDGRGGRNSALGEGKKAYRVEAQTVDDLLQGEVGSYIKMDVEGAERETLLGCKKTMAAFAPKLAVSAYHRTWDFVDLPLLIWKLNPAYRIFLRHHPYIPAWETNLYAVKE